VPVHRPTACCEATGCFQAGVIETLSHAFLDCPEVTPVIDWMLDTWHHLAGFAIPRQSSLLLADDPTLWPQQPLHAPTFRLWTFFRVTTIGAIWQVRCSRREGSIADSFARKAISIIVSHITSAIKRDWMRSQKDLRQLDDGAFCQDWWRGLDCAISVNAFAALWATPAIFCEVLGPPPVEPQLPDQRTLELRIFPDLPIPMPPRFPQPPPPDQPSSS
jgi:hypothetical protein